MITRLRISCGECWAKSKRLRELEPSAALQKDWGLKQESAWRMGAFRNSRLTRTPERICGLASFRFCVYETLFQGSYRLFKKRLECLCLMSYDISYDLCLMSHLMSDVICSHGFGLCFAFGTKTCDFVTRVSAFSWVDMSFSTHSYSIWGTSTPNGGLHR